MQENCKNYDGVTPGYTDIVGAMKEDVKIRITPEEKEAFTKAAEIEGLSLSAWMRTHLKDYLRATQPKLATQRNAKSKQA